MVALTLPSHLMQQTPTYIHSSADNFDNTVSQAGLIKVLEGILKDTRGNAIGILNERRKIFLQAEREFINDMYEEGYFTGKDDKRRAVLRHFKNIKNGKSDGAKIATAISGVKDSYLKTSRKSKSDKEAYYSDLKGRIEGLIGLLEEASKKEEVVYNSIGQAGLRYKQALAEVKAFKSKLKKEYNQEVYKKQGVMQIGMGLLLEPALVAYLDEEVKLHVKNMGAEGDKKTTGDIRIFHSASRDKSSVIDVKSNSSHYRNQRVYTLQNISDYSATTNDANIFNYISYNFFNLMGTYRHLGGNYKRIYLLLRRIMFFHTFHRNLIGTEWESARAEEVLIITPNKTMYFSDFMKTVADNLANDGQKYDDFGDVSFKTIRHGDYDKKHKKVVKNYNSLRGHHYRAKLEAIKRKGGARRDQGYMNIAQDSKTAGLNSRIVSEIKSKTKITTKLSLSTSKAKV